MTNTVPLMDEKKAAVSKIETRATSACQEAQAFHIENDEQAIAANAFLNEVINPLIREGDELFEPMIASAYQTHQLAIATKRKAVGALPAAKTALRNELGRWAQFVENQERERRLRIEREAREIEAKRVEREVVAIEQSDAPDVVEQVQAVLDAPRADLKLAPAEFAAPARVIPSRDVYKAEVVNLREFFKAVGDGRIPMSLAKVDQGALDRRAGTDKEGFNLPGCRLLTSKSVSSARTR